MRTKYIIGWLMGLNAAACANRTPTADQPGADTTVAVTVTKPVPDSFPVGKVIRSVVCHTDPTQSYALYIPAKGDSLPLPVVYFFDPHADGALPLDKYKSLAETYGFILVGSNNSKNGNDWPTADAIWRGLSADVLNRLKINRSRIYVCGFSGGAKVAGYVATQFKASGIRAVIANGAALPDGIPAANFDFSFTAVAGEGDLNLTDLVATDKDLNKTVTRHRIIFFDGKHEWAPVATMALAFAGLQFDAMAQAVLPVDAGFIKQYAEGSKKRVEAYYKANQLIKAMDECALSIHYLNGLPGDVAWFNDKRGSLEGNAAYQKQLQAQEQLLVVEQNTKNTYMQQFQQGDMAYWTGTINDLQKKAAAKTAESGMYQRLLAYLSLAFYSYSNHLINSNANSQARYFTELYKMADPTNSEAWYFSAILDARDHQPQAAESDLLKAAGFGFKDKERMLQQPEFQTLSPQINFPAIEHKMETPGN